MVHLCDMKFPEQKKSECVGSDFLFTGLKVKRIDVIWQRATQNI
jgi:hypothetical protein